MTGPPIDERRLRGDRADRQRAGAIQRWWATQFASNRPPGRSGRTPVFVALWTILAMVAAIAGMVTGDLGWALGFVVVGFGLVLASLTDMIRDEFVRWVAPLNLLALALMAVGAAILWTA